MAQALGMRSLFLLGQLCRHAADSIDAAAEAGDSKLTLRRCMAIMLAAFNAPNGEPRGSCNMPYIWCAVSAINTGASCTAVALMLGMTLGSCRKASTRQNGGSNLPFTAPRLQMPPLRNVWSAAHGGWGGSSKIADYPAIALLRRGTEGAGLRVAGVGPAVRGAPGADAEPRGDSADA